MSVTESAPTQSTDLADATAAELLDRFAAGTATPT
ncbi:MAG: hypothetical protein QOH45_228, partial [Pseudonocardiales bacterium]|nr:hypothetical protein [Pseudonocardiales bacterium]